MSTPTKQSTKAKKPSQTSRILESVELLLAIQEEQESSRGLSQEQTEKLADQLEALEKKLNRLPEVSCGHGSPSEQSGADTSGWSDRFEQFEFYLTDQLEKITDQVATQSPEQTDLSELRFSQFESSIVDRIDAMISSKLEKQLSELEKFNQPGLESCTNFSEKAAQQLTESNNKVLKQQALLADQLSQVSAQLDGQSKKLLEALKQLPSRSSEGGSHGDSSLSESFEASFELLTEHVDDKTNEIADSIETSLTKRLDALKTQLMKLETQNAFLSESASLLENVSSLTRCDVAEEVKLQNAVVTSELKSHFAEIIGKQVPVFGGLAGTNENSMVEPEIAPTEDDDSASHWHKQKRAMLEKYGIDPNYRPLEEEKKKSDKPESTSASAAEKGVSAVKELEGMHESINRISPEDSDAIEKLKKDLNSKLRDAEVELSINRAKVSQERAELEKQQSELEQRAARLESKLAASQDCEGEKQGGIMSRFTRHLGRGK